MRASDGRFRSSSGPTRRVTSPSGIVPTTSLQHPKIQCAGRLPRTCRDPENGARRERSGDRRRRAGPAINSPMAKLLYSVTMSADGFIAGPNGDMQWMRPYLAPNPEVDELITKIGSILVGRRSHDGDDPHKGEPGEGEAFGGGWEGALFVVTHRLPETSEAGITYVDQLPKAIAAAKAAAGD